MTSKLEKKQTKIIATLGPASSKPEVLRKMILAGADLIRLNASHFSDPREIDEVIKVVRKVLREFDQSVGIFLDLQGPKIRVRRFEKDKVLLEPGKVFSLITDKDVLGDERQVSFSYPGSIHDLEIGHPVFIDDGNIRLEVEKHLPNGVECRVVQGGWVSNNKGVNLPMTRTSGSILTEKDRRDVVVAVKQHLDYVALSFISSARDVQELREYMGKIGKNNIGIISKIERRSAVDNIGEIIQVSDAVMVARGDLGVEIGIEKVPAVQKLIIRESIRYIKPAIVATQMLESMVTKLVATRAEVSDVANAIYDRCDAVMLSGETAVGVDPANAIGTMKNICLATDTHLGELKLMKFSQAKRVFERKTMATSLCKAADQIADENNANALLAFTSSGNTALISSKLNPSIPIIAATDDKRVYGKMALYRGVTPILMQKRFRQINGWSRMIEMAVQSCKKMAIFKSGDRVVVTAGIPIGYSGGTNSIRLIEVP